MKRKLQDQSTRYSTLESLLGTATERLDIYVYVIDKCGAEVLRRIKESNKSLKIRLLISKDVLKEDIRGVLAELSRLGLEIRVAEKLHSKVYIIDGVWVVEGSANLTCRSLKENVENMSFEEDPRRVALSNFEKIWEVATPYTSTTFQ